MGTPAICTLSLMARVLPASLPSAAPRMSQRTDQAQSILEEGDVEVADAHRLDHILGDRPDGEEDRPGVAGEVLVADLDELRPGLGGMVLEREEDHVSEARAGLVVGGAGDGGEDGPDREGEGEGGEAKRRVHGGEHQRPQVMHAGNGDRIDDALAHMRGQRRGG